MMLSEQIRGLTDLVEEIGGVSESLEDDTVDAPADIEEQSGRVPASSSGIHVKVKPVLSKQIGQDELRMVRVDGPANDPPGPGIPSLDGGPGFTRTSFGNRVITFKITVVQDDASDDGLAFPICENIRSRLQLPSSTDQLETCGLGISEFSDIENADEVEDDRVLPAAFFMAVFNASVSYEDTPVESIETVNAEYEEPES